MDLTSRRVAGSAVLLLSLLATAVTSAPVPDDLLEVYTLSETLSPRQVYTVLRLLRLLDTDADTASPNTRDDAFGTGTEDGDYGNSAPKKRGFGIAGLDNVDMITSTLDRSRSLSRSRQTPVMSPGLSIEQLRELMRKAG